MNYRHAFHAGNHADCLKHALLVAILARLARKATPFAVLDTHAGPGAAALDGPEACRTGEWRAGIGRLLDATPLPPPLASTLAALRQAGLGRPGESAERRYPGSPLIVASLLRVQDRLIATELRAEDASSLRATLAPFPNAAVHRRDGYESVRALLPFAPPHRRGLVLIDPPYERDDDWERAATAMALARRRVPGATVAVWYPIKGRAASRAFHASLVDHGIRDLRCYELLLRDPVDASRLDGSGLAVAAAPFGLDEEAHAILAALRDVLAPDSGSTRAEILADEEGR